MSTTTIDAIPSNLRTATARTDFLRWLRDQPAPAPYKKALLFGWSRWVGHVVTADEVDYIIPGGDSRTIHPPLIPVNYPEQKEPPESLRSLHTHEGGSR